MRRVSNRTWEEHKGAANLFLSINHSRKERLQRISEILHPLLLEPRKFRLDESRGLVKVLLGVQCLSLSLDEVNDVSRVVRMIDL